MVIIYWKHGWYFDWLLHKQSRGIRVAGGGWWVLLVDCVCSTIKQPGVYTVLCLLTIAIRSNEKNRTWTVIKPHGGYQLHCLQSTHLWSSSSYLVSAAAGEPHQFSHCPVNTGKLQQNKSRWRRRRPVVGGTDEDSLILRHKGHPQWGCCRTNLFRNNHLIYTPNPSNLRVYSLFLKDTNGNALRSCPVTLGFCVLVSRRHTVKLLLLQALFGAQRRESLRSARMSSYQNNVKRHKDAGKAKSEKNHNNNSNADVVLNTKERNTLSVNWIKIRICLANVDVGRC